MPAAPELLLQEEDRLAAKLVLVTTWVASIFALALAGIGLIAGNDPAIAHSIAPGAIAIVGWVMVERERPNVALQLVVGMAGLAFMVFVTNGNSGHDPLLGYVAMGVVGALFARRYVAAFVGVAAIGSGLIAYVDSADGTVLARQQAAFAAGATFLFLAWLMIWLKRQWFESQRELRELIRSKDELVASVSHELRTPLTTVVGLARELDERFDDFNAKEVEEFLQLIVNESSDVAGILEDLLVGARANVGNLALDIRPVELASLIGPAMSFAPSATLQVGAGGETLRVLGDPGRIRQILRNLTVNAVRYGGPAVRVVVERCGEMAAIAVRDNGPPIPQEERDRIFEAYHRKQPVSSIPGAVGLGLTVSRELARRMDGDVAYDHDGTEGAFTLTLPLAAEAAGDTDALVEVTPAAM